MKFTVAPFAGGVIWCKHNLAAGLTAKSSKLTPEQRMENFVKSQQGNEALALRANRAVGLVKAGDVKPEGNGYAVHGHHVEDGHCDCMDWQNGYSAHIAALKAANALPNPPVE